MKQVESTISVKITEEMEERIVSQLSYGDSKSAYIRESVAERLEDEGVVDDGEALLP
jgi:predicted DNA-binding protein